MKYRPTLPMGTQHCYACNAFLLTSRRESLLCHHQELYYQNKYYRGKKGLPWWSLHHNHSSDSCFKFSFNCFHPYQEKHTEAINPSKTFDSSWFLNNFKASSWKRDGKVEKVSFLFESSQKHLYPSLWEQDNTRFILQKCKSCWRLEVIPAAVSGTIIQIPKQVKTWFILNICILSK